MAYGKCVLCHKVGYMHLHHIFDGRRKQSERYGLTCLLCPICHIYSDHSVHMDESVNRKLKRAGQAKFERTHTREEFIQIFGRNYL